MTAPITAPATRPSSPEPPAARPPARSARRHARRTATGATTVDRADRLALAVVGLAAIGLGLVPLLAADGTLDLRPPSALYADAVDAVQQHPGRWAGIAIVAGVVLTLLGLWGAWAQVRPRPDRGRLGTTRLPTGGPGRTTLAPAPVAHALAADVESVEGVHRATARIVALRPQPTIVLTVEVDPERGLAAVRHDLEAPLARVAAALDADTVDAEIRCTIARRSTRPRVA